jgi:hypothetical protein
VYFFFFGVEGGHIDKVIGIDLMYITGAMLTLYITIETLTLYITIETLTYIACHLPYLINFKVHHFQRSIQMSKEAKKQV